ncbi:MAG: hypothetical protein RLZZ536_2988 [Planctomycetota bacterium]|jgi:hypothetical protein
MGVVLKGGTELVLVGSTSEGEAPAEPWDSAARQQFGSAGASPSRMVNTPGKPICS